MTIHGKAYGVVSTRTDISLDGQSNCYVVPLPFSIQLMVSAQNVKEDEDLLWAV